VHHKFNYFPTNFFEKTSHPWLPFKITFWLKLKWNSGKNVCAYIRSSPSLYSVCKSGTVNRELHNLVINFFVQQQTYSEDGLC
jgi:hypothetical protein